MNKVTFPKQFPRLETERLILRAVTPDDEQAVFRNFSDEAVVEHLMEPFTTMKQAESIVAKFIATFERGKGLFWAITCKQDDAFIGTCRFESVEFGALGEVGFDLAPSHWGQGLMSEALRAVIRYGFERLGLTKIEAFTSIHNARAVNLLKRLDFQVSGTQEEIYRFFLLRQDWGGTLELIEQRIEKKTDWTTD